MKVFTEKVLLNRLEKYFSSYRGKVPVCTDFKNRKDYLFAKLDYKYLGSPLGQSASGSELQEVWERFSIKSPNVIDELSFLYTWANGSHEDILRKEVQLLKIKDSLDLLEAYESFSDDEEPLIVSKNLNCFYPVFSLRSNDISGEIGVFINEGVAVYLLDIEETCVYKIFDSILILLEFIVASMDLQKEKRGHGITYSKEERLILEQLNHSEVYPMVKKVEDTIFT